jgi:hypothetical protein
VLCLRRDDTSLDLGGESRGGGGGGAVAKSSFL